MNNKPHKKVLIIGAGALGIITAVKLAKAGHEVFVAVRSTEKAEFLKREGLKMTEPDGNILTTHLNVVFNPSEVIQPFELLINAVKCSAAVDAALKWLPVLKIDGIFVSYQNGLMGDEMKMYIEDRFVECAVYYPATLLNAGHSYQTGPGHLHLGPWPKGDISPNSKTAVVADLLSDVVPTFTYNDMFSVKWNKLVANSVMTSLGVISGLGMKEMMEHSFIRNTFIIVAKESMTVAKAAGAKSISLGGFNPGLLIQLPLFISHIALRLVTRKQKSYKSSSLQSLERGEPTEVDFLNGRIVTEATRLGIPAPCNSEITKIVHEIELNPLSAGLGRMKELYAFAIQLD